MYMLVLAQRRLVYSHLACKCSRDKNFVKKLLVCVDTGGSRGAGWSSVKGSQKVLVEEHCKDVAKDQRTWWCALRKRSRGNDKQE